MSTEALRPRLERLRGALRHWQICSTEYESLRRELSSLPLKANREDMLEVGMKSKRKVVDEKEVKNLLGDELGIKRTVIQVITEITHRIDYAQENIIKIEEQIEQGENEIDENEEDEEDEYEAEDDAKYKPTAEGLVSPELQEELEEFRKRIKERGDAARAEEAKWVAEEQAKPKKKRKGGGVRFADPDEESKPEPTVSPKRIIPSKESFLAIGAKDKLHTIESLSRKLSGDGVQMEEDEDAKLQSSIAEQGGKPPKRVMLTTVTRSMARERSLAASDIPTPSPSGDIPTTYSDKSDI